MKQTVLHVHYSSSSSSLDYARYELTAVPSFRESSHLFLVRPEGIHHRELVKLRPDPRREHRQIDRQEKQQERACWVTSTAVFERDIFHIGVSTWDEPEPAGFVRSAEWLGVFE